MAPRKTARKKATTAAPRRKTWKKVLLIGFASIALILVLAFSLAAIYKERIVALVNDELKAALHTETSIGDADITFLADFPNITLLLQDVTVGMDSVSHRELLKARRIHFNLRTFRLLFGKIEFRSVRLQDADIYLFKSSSGFSNMDIFKQRDTTSVSDTTAQPSQIPFERQHVILQNCRLTYHDSLKAKYYDLTFRKVDNRLVNEDSVIAISMKGPVDFGGLTFNPEKGAFLHNISLTLDLNMQYRRDSSILNILPSHANAPAGEASISGRVKFSEPKKMDLRFGTEKIEYGRGIAVLSDTLRAKLEKLKITGPMKVEVTLSSDLVPGVKPAVDIAFSFPKNRLTGEKIDVTNVSLKGTFTNHIEDNLPYDNPNSVIHLSEIHGEIDGLPFHAEAKLINPSDMRLDLHSVHAFDLTMLNDQADTSVLKFTRGYFSSEFRYSGKLKEYLDPTVTEYTGDLNGTMSIKDGSFNVVGRKLKFNDLNTSVHFTEDTVTIEKFGVKSGKSSVEMNGMVLNFVPLFVQPEGKGFVRLNINSPYLDVGSLLSAQKKKMSARKAASQKQKVSDMLDVIFKNLQFDVNVNIDKYKNKSFEATRVKGDLRLKGTSLDAKNVTMDFGKGTLLVNASMRDLHKKINPVEVTARMRDVHIKDFFRAFDNFGQKTITDDNLYGSINMDTKLRTKVDDNFNVIIASLTGKVSLTVLNGRLVNFEPVEKMGNFLFKKRDFEDVKFAQINCDFDVVSRDLDIARMEIESTVLRLFLEGTYSLDKKHTDLTIQVPLSNLKKRDRSYVPERVGEDSKVGASVFLRAQSDEKGETSITYDPFNKRRRKKGK
jgi:hypothetical protein